MLKLNITLKKAQYTNRILLKRINPKMQLKKIAKKQNKIVCINLM